jgi:hypothetical protein
MQVIKFALKMQHVITAKGPKGISINVARNTFIVNKSVIFVSTKFAVQNSRKDTRKRSSPMPPHFIVSPTGYGQSVTDF